jgi:phosphatidylinositol kinase/protein kinase (PI-3  family)
VAATYGNAAPGSRGHFKRSSVIAMRIMRENSDTLLAMLAAFAYDPLLSWQAKDLDKDHLQEG